MSPNIPVPESELLSSAQRLLDSVNERGLSELATDDLEQLSELIALRARLSARLKAATSSADVIATTLLGDQLRACVRDVDARLAHHFERARELLARSP